MNYRSSQRSLFLQVIGFVLLALGLLGGTSLAMKECRLALFGEHVTGIVNKVDAITTSTSSKWEKVGNKKRLVSRSGQSYYMHIGFTTRDAQPFEVKTLATFNTEAKVGDHHRMIYLPSHPENAKIYSARQLWLPLLIGTGFTLVCLFLGSYLIRRPSA